MALTMPFMAACAASGSAETSDSSSSNSKKKLSIREAETGLSKMFTDDSGKAEFSCVDGGSQHDFICQGRYVSVDPSERVLTLRIGASVSSYYEGEPEFAIKVLRDGAGSK